MSDFQVVVDELEPSPPLWHGSTDVSTTVWPENLPPPELLHHLAETVFNAVPLAVRVLHRPTFMASLGLPPNSPRFPPVWLLHAICALASLYTPIVTDIGEINLDDGLGAVAVSAGVFQGGAYGAGNGFRNADHDDEDPFNFATSHLRWSHECSRKAIRRGKSMIEHAQRLILVTWFYLSRGDFISTIACTSNLTKLIASLGFNTSSVYSPLSRIPSEYLYTGRTVVGPTNEEMCRNIFWVAYAMERLVNATNVWTLSFEDMDCSQFLPCRLKDFTNGVTVPKQTRQHLLSRNMLVTHPPLFTDSFTLYVKAAVIFGQVRTFNRRYKQHYALNVQSTGLLYDGWSSPSDSGSTPPPGGAKNRDPRETKEFKALDDLIGAFIASIPKEFQDPVGRNTGAKLDPVLYVAHLLPHMAMITLHDPHANVSVAHDSSAQKILLAARGILELIYNVCGTAFDLLYLDHTSSTAWFLAGTTIIRFLAAKSAQGDEAEAAILTEELGAVKFMLTNLGDRTGIGLRQLKLLDMVYKLEIEAQAQARKQPTVMSPATISVTNP
ncbi:hypothetical protein FRB97_007673 [Tulasnella sp. 331]|nr:hypothetical protein FRB97_007673 [Tulasnella sp. 331]